MNRYFIAWCRPLPWLAWKQVAFGDIGVSEDAVRKIGRIAMVQAEQAGIYLDRASFVVLPNDEYPEPMKGIKRHKKRRSAGD